MASIGLGGLWGQPGSYFLEGYGDSEDPFLPLDATFTGQAFSARGIQPTDLPMGEDEVEREPEFMDLSRLWLYVPDGSVHSEESSLPSDANYLTRPACAARGIEPINSPIRENGRKTDTESTGSMWLFVPDAPVDSEELSLFSDAPASRQASAPGPNELMNLLGEEDLQTPMESTNSTTAWGQPLFGWPSRQYGDSESLLSDGSFSPAASATRRTRVPRVQQLQMEEDAEESVNSTAAWGQPLFRGSSRQYGDCESLRSDGVFSPAASATRRTRVPRVQQLQLEEDAEESVNSTAAWGQPLFRGSSRQYGDSESLWSDGSFSPAASATQRTRVPRVHQLQLEEDAEESVNSTAAWGQPIFGWPSRQFGDSESLRSDGSFSPGVSAKRRTRVPRVPEDEVESVNRTSLSGQSLSSSHCFNLKEMLQQSDGLTSFHLQ
ncbi:hypothetical protein R1sor_025344 [Riccia sorocarpa]|uniref:Uncharacterized protein n=1 Tax=Riccia sorocarpa TaxID=122646 RepID=A0ABD3G9Q2_9MARC